VFNPNKGVAAMKSKGIAIGAGNTMVLFSPPAGTRFPPTRAIPMKAAIGMLVAVVVGCTSTAQPPSSSAKLDNLTKVANLPGKAACFWKSNFQGDWTVLNDSTLIVHAPLPQDTYVIKLFEPVFNLSFHQGLGFEDKEHTGQICNNGDDYLVVPGWQPPQVPIIAVHALTASEQDELLRAAGKPVPQHPATQPTSPQK
jgi:hypothetical protein